MLNQNNKKGQLETGMLFVYISAILAIGFFVVITIYLISNISVGTLTESQTNSTNLILTDNYQALESGAGIQSSSITTPNQTWLEFDGVNDYVNGTDLELGYINISLIQGYKWIGNSTIANGRILQMCNRDFGLYKPNSKNYLQITYSNATNTIDSTSNNGIISDGLWKQSAIQYNGTINVWFNSTYIQSRSDITNNLNGTNNCYIGTLTNTFGNSNISIDNYRVFNKSIGQGVINYYYNSSIQGNNLGNGIPIYMLHVIDSTPTFTENWDSTIFNATIDYLYSQGYESINYQDLIDWRNNEKVLNKKSFIFSFDDGANSIFANAYPKMKENGYTGSISIITDRVGESTYMTWDKINTLIADGWEIVSHSVNTTSYLSMDSATRLEFFNLSKYQIYGNTSILPNVFIYPQNARNSTIDAECLQYYDSCVSATSTISLPEYNFKMQTNSSLNFNRIVVINTTTLQEIKNTNPYDELIKELLFNENTGTTAYDSSGNANHGIISGATWNRSDENITLVEGVDYTLNTLTGLLTLSTDYVYRSVSASWNYYTNIVSGGCNQIFSGFDTQFGIFAMAIIGFIGLVGTFFAIRFLISFIKPMISKENNVGID
jgi:peptidoglycan/xylan/chitin deacetylase (PgdA/CDA1 family)